MTALGIACVSGGTDILANYAAVMKCLLECDFVDSGHINAKDNVREILFSVENCYTKY